MLHLALSFTTWRSLIEESGLRQGAAAAVMVQAIEAVKTASPSASHAAAAAN